MSKKNFPYSYLPNAKYIKKKKIKIKEGNTKYDSFLIDLSNPFDSYKDP